MRFLYNGFKMEPCQNVPEKGTEKSVPFDNRNVKGWENVRNFLDRQAHTYMYTLYSKLQLRNNMLHCFSTK